MKKWYRSKTILLNMLVLGLAAAETQLNMIQPLMQANVYAIVAFGLPVLNAVLRVISNTGITK